MELAARQRRVYSGRQHQALRHTLEVLKTDIERLVLITEALWTMVSEQHEYSEDELVRRIHEIDLRDGRLDGKVASSSPWPCP